MGLVMVICQFRNAQHNTAQEEVRTAVEESSAK